MTAPNQSAAVRWLTAQSVAFGITIAVLGVVAFALFLDEYGSEWLPVTYMAIAVAGLVLSGTVSRAVGRWRLVQVATFVLGLTLVSFVAAWVVAVNGGAWVSAPLVVLFPVLIQLGFVFIGGQAGQLLDVGAIKVSFPRITAGFPFGAIIGGLVATALAGALDRPEHLLLASAVPQAVFLGLLRVTGWRFAAGFAAGPPGPPPPAPARAGRRRWAVGGFVGLILGYQVLSAIASQLADFLVFDRAAARYGSGVELARFIGRNTVAMNAATMVFLAFGAGALLRRHGVRLGLLANPAALTLLGVLMAVATAAGGSASLGLFSVVVVTRIADIALTDGTTRTSINASYQALPRGERLVVQAQVEGVGVPLAIGISGVIILVLDAVPFAVPALVGVLVAVSALWTLVAVLVHRGYVGALRDALERRWMSDDATIAGEDEEAAARDLLRAAAGGDVRLGLELLSGSPASALHPELVRLAGDDRLDVRLTALARLADAGDGDAQQRLVNEIAAAGASPSAHDRLVAARALAGAGTVEPDDLARFLRDDDVDVRRAALDAVGPEHLAAVDLVLDALADARTCGAASAALVRMGDAIVPAATRRLADGSAPVPPASTRLARVLCVVAPEGFAGVLRPHLRHPDRELGLTVLAGLSRPDPAPRALADEVRAVLDDDVHMVARVLVATAALRDGEPAVIRALDDELDLARRRLAAALGVLYGTSRLGAALRALHVDDHQRRALAVESLEVTLARADTLLTRPVLHPDLTATERLASYAHLAPPEPAGGWLRDLAEDPDDHWRSPWLRECARYASARHGPPGDTAPVS